MGTLGGFPNPPALAAGGEAALRSGWLETRSGGQGGASERRRREPSLEWEPWEGSQTLRRSLRAAKPPCARVGWRRGAEVRGELARGGGVRRRLNGNPGRVPKPSGARCGRRSRPALGLVGDAERRSGGS